MKMNFEEIMQKITKGLTSEPHHDVVYLQKKIEEYQGHKYEDKIVKACGSLIFEIMPKDLKEDLAKKFSNEDLDLVNCLEKVVENLINNKVELARKSLEEKIIEVERLGLFKEDKENEYRDFTGPIEEIIYKHLFNSKKLIRYAPEPYTRLYLTYGSLMFDLKEFSKAKESLLKARRWNPINSDIIFELAEINKALGNLPEFLKLTKEAFKTSYKSKQVARCYRNLGRYFIEKELYKPATICYVLSLQFEANHDIVEPELIYIESKLGPDFEQPTKELVEQYAKEYDFPTWASEDVIGLSISYAKDALTKKDYIAARYFLNIVFDLTKSKEVKEKLAEIKDLE